MSQASVSLSAGENAAAHSSQALDMCRSQHECPHRIVWNFCKSTGRILGTLLFDLKTYGTENVPRTGGALLISNHQSLLDPVLLGVQLKRSINFIAKVELFENRFGGWLMKELNTFPVRRGEGDVGAIKEAIRRLKEGRILTMFPEGTRSADGELRPIQPGIAMLVRRAGVPVIPAVIDGSFSAWPKGKKIFRPHPVRVMYGPALAVEGMKGAQIVEVIDQTFHRMLGELRQKRREELAASPS